MKRSTTAIAMLLGVVAILSFGIIVFSKHLAYLDPSIGALIRSSFIPLVLIHYVCSAVSIIMFTVCVARRRIDKISFWGIVLCLLSESVYLSYMLFFQ